MDHITGGVGKLTPSLYRTQRLNVLRQLCTGSRWFDLRFLYTQGQWRIWHGMAGFNGFGNSLDEIMQMLEQFLNHPSHRYEVVVIRIKLQKGDVDDFASQVYARLSPLMVHSNQSVVTLSLEELESPTASAPKATGQLIVLAYGWNVSSALGAKIGFDWLWQYSDVQTGTFSDSHTMLGMLTKCDAGQEVQLAAFKHKHSNVSDVLFGLWWTFTAGDILKNTDNKWKAYPNGLHQFFLRNQGEIGNVLIVDCWGCFPQVMDLIWYYNVMKFATNPPPATLTANLNFPVPANKQPLPGENIHSTGVCSKMQDSATRNGTMSAIAVVICFLALILSLLGILLCSGIQCYRAFKRRRCHRIEEPLAVRDQQERVDTNVVVEMAEPETPDVK